MELNLRPAELADASEVTRILLEARRAAMPDVDPVLTPQDTLRWVQQDVLARKQVTVALDRGAVVGFAAVRDDWLDQIYVDPTAQACGVGRALLDSVKRARPSGFRLVVFQRNDRARGFYEKHGLGLVEFGDGSRTPEGELEAIYEWRGEPA